MKALIPNHKNMKTTSLVLLLLIFLNSGQVLPQGFNSITTPDGNHITAAGNNGLIYYSSNSGTNWFSRTELSVNFKSVFSINNKIWIAGDNSTVYKTDLNITSISLYNVPGNYILNSVYFADENLGFVCGDNGAVFKSVNGGINWVLINAGLPQFNLNSISFKDENTGIVAGNNGAVYSTTNGGDTWIQEIVPTQKNLLKVKYFSDGIAVSGEYGTLMLKQGAGWELIDTKVQTSIKSISGLGINNVHVCGGGGFIRNKNGSSDFLNFEPNPMMADLEDIFYYDSNTGFAVSSLNKAILKTSSGGTEWFLTAGGSVNYSWEEKLSTSGGFGNTLCVHPFDINSIFVVMEDRIYVSRNRGNNWRLLDSLPYSGARSFYVSPLDTNIWVAAASSRILKSVNYGKTWSVTLEAIFSHYGQPLEMDQNDPSVFYFAPDAGGFYKSTDTGASFELISNFPFQSPCDIIVKWNNSAEILVGRWSDKRFGSKSL
ncbi:MAG: hypothetical protein IPM38_02105 [Ignavibacteria bacterium]|nr:hypothetical protein [Ignavibacteria bacterium]